jgi:hypothetical protein
VVGGRARKTIGHSKPVENWTVLIRDHHPGYITWEQYERNQALLADNAHMKSRMEPAQRSVAHTSGETVDSFFR